MKRKNRRRIIAFSVIGILLFAASVLFVMNTVNRNRMLKAVHLEHTAGLKQIDYASRTDPLKYTDGYEIMVFSVDIEQWQTPEEWTNEENATDLSDLEASLDIHLDYQAILGLSLGGTDCSAWYFSENKAQGEYYLGYLYDHYERPLIFIYHGHHLYGIN